MATSSHTPLRCWSSRQSSGPRRGTVPRSIPTLFTIGMMGAAVRSFSFRIPDHINPHASRREEEAKAS